MQDFNNGIFFPPMLQKEIRSRFCLINEDPDFGRRLFFENSGGSLRLQAAVDAKTQYDPYPDCPERDHNRSLILKQARLDGIDDIMHVLFGAKSGQLIVSLTASQVIFQMVRTIAENVRGTNLITSILEHPSAFDATQYYAQKMGMELRVVYPNPVTGCIEPEAVAKLVDKNTCFINIMSASNIVGSIMDMEAIVKAARAINPDVYIITDAVQHAPHTFLDVEALGIDGVTFAPYKFFGTRGSGFGYISDRLAALPHDKLIGKDNTVWELGSPTPSDFAAMSAVINYVCWIGDHFTDAADKRARYIAGMERIHLQERALLARMLDGSDKQVGLRDMEGVSVFVDYPDLTKRDLIVGMGFDGQDLTRVREEYVRRGVIVFERVNTSIYSKRIVEAFGLAGVIRVSPLHCHDADDIDEYLRITQEISQSLNK